MTKRNKNSPTKEKEFDDELKELIQKKKNEKQAWEKLLQRLKEMEIK